MIRAVLDANVFVSALIRPEGPPGRILGELVEHAAFTLVLSPRIIDEIRKTLREPRLRRYIPLTAQEADAWLASVQSIGEMVKGSADIRIVEDDPADDKYFAAAVDGEADFVVSGDAHVLAVGRYERIRVLTPRAFLDKLR